MGIFDKLFGKENKSVASGAYPFYTALDGMTPIYTRFNGGVYEMELTRACIHTFANHCSKLEPHVRGADLRGLQHILDHRPNPFQTSAQFLYKTATIYDTENTVYIVPILNQYDQTVGYYPINPSLTEAKDVGGEMWLVFQFTDGEMAAIEWSRCGMVSKFLYSSDIRGENNMPLIPTMQLLDTQNKGIENSIKNSGRFRFMARSMNVLKEKDIEEYRKNFVRRNMSEEDSGLIVFPRDMFEDPKVINSDPKFIDAEQVKLIEQRVYNYFGTSEDILQNRAHGDAWSAYYEGKIEPFSIQLSQALSCMTFSANEMSRGNEIMYSANRLQYMNDSTKLAVTNGLRDRGIITTNQALDIWNLPHVEGGDTRFIRKEYAEIDENGTVITQPVQVDETITTQEGVDNGDTV